MTLKSLFFNLQKEDLKRRIWTIALFILVFFLGFPVICALELGSSYTRTEVSYDMLLQLLGVNFGFASIFTIVCAIICGLSSFFYLHSKKKVDLFHSLPVRREFMFAVNFIDGLLIFIVPYIINVIACYVIIAINKLMTVQIFVESLKAIAINSLFFILIYTIVIIAVMLTGNLVVSCLGSGVFLSYGAILMALKEMYYSQFFSTYSGRNNSGSFLKVITPFYIYLDILNSEQISVFRLFKVMLVTIVLIAFALYLYKKRPSEAAGKAMSFQISKPIIKFLIVVPISLAGGIFFSNVSMRSKTAWYIFGLLFFAIIISIIIEMIYNFDVKSAFKKKREMVIALATVGIIASIFHFDLIKYDAYLPEKTDIASMSIAVDSLDNNINTYSYRNGYREYRYVNYVDFQLNRMELTDLEAGYALAELGVNNILDLNDYNNRINYTVKYNLKNGKEIYREYVANRDDSYELLKKIYSNIEYKEAHYPIYSTELSDITRIEFNDIINGASYKVSKDDYADFIQIFKEDLNRITLDDIANHSPIATVSIGNENYDTNYYINDKYTNTITFLKEHGFNTVSSINNIESIYKIVASNLNYNENEQENIVKDEYNQKYGSYSNSLSKTYTDQEEILELLPRLISNDYYWANSSVIQTIDGLEFTIYFKDESNGDYITRNYYMLKEQVPDFIKEDLQYK
jgi:hypothetical protein